MNDALRIILEKIKESKITVEEGAMIIESMMGSTNEPQREYRQPPPQAQGIDQGRPGPSVGEGGGDIQEAFLNAGIDPGESQKMAAEVDRILRETLGGGGG